MWWGEFPGGEGGALGAGAGFVAIDVKLFALGLGGVHGGGGAADVNKGEPAGVAVGEDARAIFDELGAVATDGAAVGDVVLGELVGGGEGEFLFLGNGAAGGEGGADVVHGVDEVNGGGAGGGEVVVNAGHVAVEGGGGFAGECSNALGEPIRGGGPDGARAAHGHIGDGECGLFEIFCACELEGVRELALLDEHNFVGACGKGNGAVMTSAAIDANVHLTPPPIGLIHSIRIRRFPSRAWRRWVAVAGARDRDRFS